MDQNSDHTSKPKDEIMASQNLLLEERNKVEKHEIESLIDAVWSLSTDDVDVKSAQNERTTLHGESFLIKYFKISFNFVLLKIYIPGTMMKHMMTQQFILIVW